MYISPEFHQKSHLNLSHCSAFLVKKGLVRAMVQLQDAAINLCSSPERKFPMLLCFKNLRQRTYSSEQRFLRGNVTTLWLNQNLSHRASSN